MLEHIGITINKESDIQAFYKDLLGLEEVKKFELYKDFSEKLFGISNTVSVTVFLLKRISLTIIVKIGNLQSVNRTN